MNRNQTPARLRHAVALAVGLGCSSVAASIGLGPIQVNSSIGQPMSATIRVDGLDAATAKGATVQLASAAAYRARGIELLPIHQKLRFSLVPAGKGYVIRVTSTTGIREPFLNFLLTINSNGSTITREYAAFFNQDPLNPNAGSTMLAEVPQGKTAPAEDGKGKKGKQGKGKEAKEQLAENTAGIDFTANNLNNRKALADNDRSEPKTAAKENRKTKAEQPPAPRKKATPLRAASPDNEGWGGHDVLAARQKQTTPQPQRGRQSEDGRYSYYSSDVKPGSIAVGSTYGPVRDNETLFSIANAARPSEDVSIQQMMRAIYNANRGSFAHNNMGNLMVGSTLVIPDPGAATAPAPVRAAKNTDIAANDKAAKKEKKADNAPAKAEVPAKTDEIAAAAPAADNVAANNAQNPPAADNIAANGAQNPPVALVQNDAPAETALPPENIQMDGNQLTLDNTETLLANNGNAAETPAAPAAATNPEEQPAALPAPEAKPAEIAAADEPAAPPAIPAMESKPVVAVVEEQPADKVSTGMPLPLLAAAGVGVLSLGGAAAYFITRRRRHDDDSMEEFSQDEIDRMVSEMEAREGVKAGHDMAAGELKPRRKKTVAEKHDPAADLEGLQQLNSQLSELEKLNDHIGIPKFVDDGEPHSAEELPDDFFKDLELPGDEEPAPVAAAAAQPAAADEEEHDFFSDLEAFAAAEPAATPSAAADADDSDFDLPDFGADETPAATPAAKPSLAKAEPAPQPAAAEEDDDLDFLSFAAEDAPAAKAKPAPQPAAAATDDDDDFDFISFASDEPAAEPAPAAKSEPAPQPVAAATDDGDDFDFISFASDEPAPAAKAEPASPPAAAAEKTTAASESTGDDDLDFFNSLSLADEPAAEAAPAAAAPEVSDEDNSVIDFFASDEEPAPVEAEEAEEKPAAAKHTHSVVSDAVVVAAAADDSAAKSETLDFFSLQDEPAAAAKPAAPPANGKDTAAASQPAAAPPAAKPVAATIAPASSDIDIEAMEINLDMATSFIVMGKAEKARSWLDEVLVSGSEAQKIRARSMLEQLEKA